MTLNCIMQRACENKNRDEPICKRYHEMMIGHKRFSAVLVE